MESSRPDLLNDMAEHRSTLKNYQNTYFCPFIPKTGKNSLKQMFGFHCVSPRLGLVTVRLGLIRLPIERGRH